MSLSLVHRPEPQDVALAPARFEAPGGTIGGCAGNTLVLPDARGQVARLQAVVRLQPGMASIQALAAGCPVAVNGQTVAPGDSRGLRDGDELSIGRFVLAVHDEHAAKAAANDAAAPAMVATPQPAQSPAAPAHDQDAAWTGVPPVAAASSAPLPDQPMPVPASAQPAPADDVFADLFGPGTLPVGSAPDMSCHPFDLDSAAPRNAADPLALVPPAPPEAPRSADPLAFFDANDPAYAPSVFSDRTPSTLPLRPDGTGTIADVLDAQRPGEGASTHDHARQMGGYMRPASVAPRTEPQRSEAPGHREPKTGSR